ncbi:hypothetical protein [Noviherbaspirillum pedocola]|uniref:Uncharacterized protein n=1 Tax=Noviherbaspirillum pedocola TaxID=2801341 RepID=A0A934W7Q3_9BURK|nr:hypothetical protein [Noviherbaspirillum pedocola]MBK4736645.1 hypothetical protein [Noviherbaspirillum pedocola]
MNARATKTAAVKPAAAQSAPDGLASQTTVTAPAASSTPPAVKPSRKTSAPKAAQTVSASADAAKPDAGSTAKVGEAAKPAKVSGTPAAKPAKASAAATSKQKPKKAKLVRDSFTMPESEYALLAELKSACLKAGFEAKKSQLLRVGVAMLKAMDIESLRREINALTPLKLGRPKKSRAVATPKG